MPSQNGINIKLQLILFFAILQDSQKFKDASKETEVI